MNWDAPDWSVICDLLPEVVHVRNDGHECKRPIVAHRDMTRAQLERLRKLAPRRSPAPGDGKRTR